MSYFKDLVSKAIGPLVKAIAKDITELRKDTTVYEFKAVLSGQLGVRIIRINDVCHFNLYTIDGSPLIVTNNEFSEQIDKFRIPYGYRPKQVEQTLTAQSGEYNSVLYTDGRISIGAYSANFTYLTADNYPA